MSLIDSASLIVTPNGYKEGKLYSVIPSDGSGDLSVTRATTATRVNSAGLVELVPYNLFQYSEQFDNVYWNKNNVNIVANSLVAPNGTTTADTMTSSGTTSFTYIATSSLVGTYTLSFYAKKGTSDYCWVYLNGYNAIFNLNTGAYVTSISNAPQSYNIENVGNGWYRVSITQANPALDGFSGIGVATASSFNGVVGSNIYIWGAQLVEGSTAKDYQKTETRLNIPRLDYSNGTCPSLLVEPQRTNIYTWSSSFDNAAWSKTDASIIASAIISPDGLVNASKLNDNTNNAQHGILRFIVGLASPTTISFFVKEAEYSRCCIENYSDGGRVVFNISTMSVVSTSSNFTNATVEEYANGFIRVSATTVGTSGNKAFGLGLINNSGQNSFVGTGTSGIYVYGAQAEAGAYPTSYIPTTSASVTRNADVISKTGISSLIGQTQGTMFVDFICNGFTDFGTPLCINDGSTANSIWITTFGNGDIRGEVFGSSNVQATFTYSGGVVGQRYKLALVYKANDFAMYVNGTLVGSDSSGTLPINLSRVDFDYANASLFVKSALEIKAAALWKTRLDNDTLEVLTGTGFTTYADMANYYNYTIQ
jgi:hypothetical protein